MTIDKLYKSILKDIATEEKGAKDTALPDMLRFGHKRVLEMLKKYKKKIGKELM